MVTLTVNNKQFQYYLILLLSKLNEVPVISIQDEKNEHKQKKNKKEDIPQP